MPLERACPLEYTIVMSPKPHCGIDSQAFAELADTYRRAWAIDLSAVGIDGAIVLGQNPCDPDGLLVCQGVRALAIREALRWGGPTVQLCRHGRLIWALPLMHNSQTVGGLVASLADNDLFPDGQGRARIDIRQACDDLRRQAALANVTNEAYLQQRREEYTREQERAVAIHDFGGREGFTFQRAYLSDESQLMAAIRNDDRPHARKILNAILLAIHAHCGSRMMLVHSYFMELVVTMCRTAVEHGGQPEQLLGANFARITALARIDSMEQLAAWLHEMLERIMDCLHRHRSQQNTAVIKTALDYMAVHHPFDITREDAARAANLSPSHFARLLRKETSRTFADLLNQFRVNRAAELLQHTEMPLAAVALEAGFQSQSYFTKVFRKYTGTTPRQHRLGYANRQRE